jgi:hypothetical protein
LKCGIEFPNGLLFADALVTLQPLDDRAACPCDGHRQLCLSGAWRTFDDDWLLHLVRQKNQ